jgi:uncharacterized membrane protein
MTHISAFYSASSHHSNSGNAFSSTWTTSVHPHRLALIFMVLSTGSLYDLETDPNDFSVAERYYKLATASLSIANFLDASTIPALQCLVSCSYLSSIRFGIPELTLSFYLSTLWRTITFT